MDLGFLQKEDFVFFRTRDFALVNSLSISAATEQLKRLEKKNIIVRLVRGVWANHKHPYFNSSSAIPYLTKDRVYISFLTALSRYGVVSQIPQIIQVATTGKSKILKTKIADYEFIQLGSGMFRDGIQWSDEIDTRSRLVFQIASPEKALLDCLYLATRKAKRFKSLPELDLSLVDIKKMKSLLELCVDDIRIKAAVEKIFGAVSTESKQTN
jgi:predicted transcriptional regulator of viral defense system